ncbi:MAG: metallophosphoesterase [Fimbriimonadaceae bacterium]|nr:metallophosphoesterase [Fimbriimonadaceae bacterium]
MQPERGCPNRARVMLENLVARGPDLVILGGDLVMNAAGADRARADALYDTLLEALAILDPIPWVPILGNTDPWGWNQKSSGVCPADALYGKALAVERLGCGSLFRSVKLAGWELLCLDSLQLGGRFGYQAAITGEQRNWLDQRLNEDRETPVAVFSHVPFLPGPASMFGMDIFRSDKYGKWPLPEHQIHVDAWELWRGFVDSGRVRLTFSGHCHNFERIDYQGITAFSANAFSGAWWRGPHLGSPPGCLWVTLGADGSWDVEMLDLGDPGM